MRTFADAVGATQDPRLERERLMDFFVIIAVLAGIAMVAGAIGFVVWWIRN